MRKEVLLVLHAGTYSLQFRPYGPACACRVANHQSAVIGTKVVYTPTAHIDEGFAKVHQYTGMKTLTNSQRQALHSFSRIFIQGTLDRYDSTSEGA